MDRQRRSTSNSSEGVRWSLDSIELEQPSFRLITPGEEGHDIETHIASVASVSGPTPSDSGTPSPGKIDDNANSKTEEDTQATELHFRTHARAKNRFILLEWWEEILSLAVAIICTALSVAVLVYMNGRSLEEWKLPLQPNTLVAFLATITRAALIYPLAECLGNLKWRYFERPQTLAHFQTFDAASRGPLGALKYLWSLPVHLPLASFAAIITTLLLLFQPFAQQTMRFASRAAPMSNEIAHAFRAGSWNTSSLVNNFEKSNTIQALFPALSYGAYKAISKEFVDDSDNGHCSTSLCKFTDFDTLAICSECEQRALNRNVENLYDNCYWRNSTWSQDSSDPFRGSHFFGVDGNSLNETTTMIILREMEKRVFGSDTEIFELSYRCGNKTKHSDPVEAIVLDIRSSANVGGLITVENHPNPGLAYALYPFGRSTSRPLAESIVLGDGAMAANYLYGLSTQAQDPEILRDGIWNVFGYARYGASEDFSSAISPNTILASTCLSLDTDLELWFDAKTRWKQFGVLNGTETKCSLVPCVQKMKGAKLQDNRFSSQSIHSDIAYRNLSDSLYCSGSENQCLYNWTRESIAFLGKWINSTMDTDNFYKMYTSQTDGPGNNFTLFFERVAAQMSSILRSQAHPYIENVTGIAYGTEVYVQVRWPWFILPLLLLASCMLMVVLSIWDSSRKNYLFKNNILAAIAFELHGWEPHEYGVDGTWSRQSMRNVEKKAERMTARMQLPQDGDGGLRLEKE